MMGKKVISILLVLTILLSMTVAAAAEPVVNNSAEFANVAADLLAGNATLTGTFSADSSYSLMLCTPYWVSTVYQGGPQTLTVSGTELVTVTTRCAPYEGWGNCIWLDVQPTEAGRTITEDTVVTGTVQLDVSTSGHAHGFAVGNVPFRFTLTVGQTDQPEVEDNVNESADFANNGAALLGTVPLSGTFQNNQKYSMMLCTAGGYWLPASYESGVQSLSIDQGGTNTELVTFRTRCAPYAPWSGASCIWVDVIPTAAAADITEDTAISGSLSVNVAGSQHFGDTQTATVHFSFTMQPSQEVTPPEEPELEENVNDTPAFANEGAALLGQIPLSGTFKNNQKYSVMLCTAGGYWLPASYESGVQSLSIDQGGTNTELVTFRTRCAPYAPWSGASCIWVDVIPTEAAASITADTVISGSLTVNAAGSQHFGQGNATVNFSFTMQPVQTEQPPVEPEGPAQVTPGAGLEDKTEESGAFADNGAALQGNLPVTGTMTKGQRLKVMLCVANGYWTPSLYESGHYALDINAGGTNTELLRFYTSCEPYAPWGGVNCIWLNIEPTEAGMAITEDAAVSGSLTMYVAGSQHFGDAQTTAVNFAINLTTEETDPPAPIPPVATPNETLKIKTDKSTTFANNGAALQGQVPVKGRLAKTQRLKLLLCVANDYWMPECYNAEPCELTVNGDGTNTELLRFYTTCEPFADWGGVPCIWLNVEPTEAGMAIEENTDISGSLNVMIEGSQHFVDAQYTTVEFTFTLTMKEEATAGVQKIYLPTPDVAVPREGLEEKRDESLTFANEGAALRELVPVKGSLSKDQRLILLLCVANGYWLPNSYNTEARELTINEGGENTELIRIYTTCEPFGAWGDAPCIWLNVEPTEAGSAITEETMVTGSFRIHSSSAAKGVADVKFAFRLSPEKTFDPVVLDLSNDSQKAYEDMIGGKTPAAVTRTIYIEEGALPGPWISTGLISYSICTVHGSACPNKEKLTAEENFFIEVTENAELVEVGWSVPDWAVHVDMQLTEAAQNAALPVTIRGQYGFRQEDGCTMQAIPFAFTLTNHALEEKAPLTQVLEDPVEVYGGVRTVEEPVPADQMATGYDILADVQACVDAWKQGEAGKTVYRRLDINTEYGPMPALSQKLAAQMPCIIDGFGCKAMKGCTWENARASVTENGELVELTFSEGPDGTILLNVVVTEAGKTIKTPAEIRGILYFENNEGGSHISEGIPFVFLLVQESAGMSGIAIAGIAAGAVLAAAAVTVILLRKKHKNAK